MLSDEERRRLDAIAGGLERDDPRLARRLSDLPRPCHGLLTRLLPTALLVLGALGLLTGLVIGDGAVIVIIGLVPMGIAGWLRRRARSGRRPRR